jgi:hypothetical protein
LNVDIEVIATSAGVLAEEALGIGLINCALELNLLIPELASHVDVSGLGSHTETNNESAFDELVRIVSKDFSILACAGL